MPTVRSYPQVTNFLGTDALLLDRVGSGTVWIDGENFQLDTANGVTNVAIYGATGNGVTDDTAAIQAAITAAGAGGIVFFPRGTYYVTATLTIPLNQLIYGPGPGAVTIYRNTDYGHTFDIPNIGAGVIQGIWFKHSDLPVSGDVTLANLVSSDTAHINIQAGQGFTIRNCWFWRMPHSVVINGSAGFDIIQNHMQGVWDPLHVAMQEGKNSLSIGASSASQIGKVLFNFFAGSSSALRSTTWTAADGATTVTIHNNIGAQNGIAISKCEDLLIHGNYFGGNSQCNILAGFGNGDYGIEWRISQNLFDGAGLTTAMIQVQCSFNGSLLNGLSITDNNFNGEQLSFQAILFLNASGAGTSPVVTNFTIEGNTSQATVGSWCMLYNARGGVVSGNSISSYNCRNTSAGADVTFCAAVWGNTATTAVTVSSNILGGSINDDLPSSYCYQGVNGTFLVERDNFWNGVGTAGAQIGLKTLKCVTITDANYTLTGYEDVVLVNNVTTANAIVVPATLPAGYRVVIKDEAGTFAAHGCQFAATVDGAVNPIYAVNYTAKTLLKNGNGANWSVISS